jgi:hypothetical protein
VQAESILFEVLSMKDSRCRLQSGQANLSALQIMLGERESPGSVSRHCVKSSYRVTVGDHTVSSLQTLGPNVMQWAFVSASEWVFRWGLFCCQELCGCFSF